MRENSVTASEKQNTLPGIYHFGQCELLNSRFRGNCKQVWHFDF